MSKSLLALIVAGLISSSVAVTYLWRQQEDWWQGWRDWLQYAPLLVTAYWLGVLHGFLRGWLGVQVWLASLLVVIVLAAVAVISNEPHILPPGVRLHRHPSPGFR